MAITITSTTAAIGINENTVRVTSTTGASTSGWMQIDGEYSIPVQIVDATTIKVRSRGTFGGSAQPHNAGAPVSFGLPEDLVAPAPTLTAQRDEGQDNIQSYSVNGAVDLGRIRSPHTDILLTKAGVLALTLAAPSAAIDGYTISFIARTANAHTLTYSAGFSGGTTSNDVATFGGAVGDSLTVKAINGTWAPIATNGVTFG
ncbi:MAG TPA: hypothetical protein VEL28_06255 [Candidatus Binatia bacterium]|nr:hypothetical protein [Candidatus Binatia bacterium]